MFKVYNLISLCLHHHIQKLSRTPLASTLSPWYPLLQAAIDLHSVTIHQITFSRIFYKWKNVYSFCVASFTQRNDFKIHSCCCIYPSFIPLLLLLQHILIYKINIIEIYPLHFFWKIRSVVLQKMYWTQFKMFLVGVF